MPVATRAAAGAALHEAAHADVLDLVLANVLSSLHQREVCALLCTSAATAAAVARNSSGRLAVSAALSTPAQSQSLSRWLGTHSGLLRSLEVSSSVANLQGPFEALPRLTGLQSLKLSLTDRRLTAYDPQEYALMRRVGGALAPLTQLTELELKGMSMDLQPLKEFPASLQRLVVEDIEELQSHHRDWIQLAHLTALTELDLGREAAEGVYIQGDDEALPPSLVRLHGKWGKAEALKGLSSLRHLGGRYNVVELLELAAVGVAAQLTHVGLLHFCYYPEPDSSDEEGEDDSSNGGLGRVVKQLTDAGVAGAVRSVELFGDIEDEDTPNLGPAMLDALKQLPVQSLALARIGYRLRDLSALTQLSRLDVSAVHEFDPNEYVFDYAKLSAELSSLPSLRELVMPTPHPQSHAAGVLNDAFVARVAQSSPQLRVVHAGLYA